MSQPPPTRTGLARAMSKLGFCSRSRATELIRMGKVKVNLTVRKNPEFPVVLKKDVIIMDDISINQAPRMYVMLNKPRGLVTSASDELGRETVFSCFENSKLPHLSPVGRLDKASEGLLLFCNDPEWAARVTDPERGPDKTYHVQIDRIPDAAQLAALLVGVTNAGAQLHARSATLLRAGEKNAWLQIVLDEGRNRQIRRLLAAIDINVLRLLRVAIGELALGDLPKGQWRWLTPAEVGSLAPDIGG